MRTNLFIIVLVFFSSMALTQSVSLHFGSNWSSVNGSNAEPERFFQHSPTAGISISSNETQVLQKSLEVQYSVKGYRTRGAVIDEIAYPNGFSNFRQHYIDVIPYFSVGLNKSFDLIAGANIGIKILETYNGQETVVPLHNTFDLGAIGGVKFGFKRYSLRLLANQGLTNSPDNIFVTDNDGNTNRLLKYRNYNVQLTLGVRIFNGTANS